MANMNLRRKPVTMYLLGRFPGDLAAMTAPDVVEGVKKLYPPDSNRKNRFRSVFSFQWLSILRDGWRNGWESPAGAGCSQ